jgi:hypothetical protein
MNRTTIWMVWLAVGAAVAGLLYGLHWFYRVPPQGPEDAGLFFQEEDLVSGGPPRDGIPSIDDPRFESTAAADQYLKDEGLGLDVEVDGDHRFYPYQILVWHEIVNDEFNGRPLVITFCPLCFTGLVYERTVGDRLLTFGTSGLLWNNNLVMYDRETDSLWSQVLGEAMSGELKGTKLTRYQAMTMSWADWKAAYPRGQVLTRETGADRDYTRDPYGNYYQTPAVWFPLSSTDSRLSSKAFIYGVTIPTDGEPLRAAYPLEAVRELGEIRDTVGGLPIVVEYDEELGTARAYRLLIDGEKGEPVFIEEAFWFIWAAAFPEVQLYQLP